jgi:hypothetical protein
MSATERGYYRFSVKETGHGTFYLAAEPVRDQLKGVYGLLGIHLQDGTTLEQAMQFADQMNNRVTSLTLTK